MFCAFHFQEALEVLRTTPTETILMICRPPMNIPDFHDTSLSRSVDLSRAHLQSQSQPALNQLTQSGSQYQSQQLVSSSGSQHNQQHQTTKPFKQTCVQCGGVQRHPPPEKSNSSASTTSLNPSTKSKSLSSLKIPLVQTQEAFGVSTQNQLNENSKTVAQNLIFRINLILCRLSIFQTGIRGDA